MKLVPLFFAFGILLVLSTNVFAYSNSGNGICECSNCNDCTNALNDNNNCSNTVKLNQSITNQAGSCINSPLNFTNKIFDCQGNTLDGDNFGTDYGIYLKSNIKTIECLNKYHITTDTVIFYHTDWCPHCQKMKPWVQNLTDEGYKFFSVEAEKEPNKVKIVKECASKEINTGGGIPQFGCPSNGELHVGEFSSISDMENFAKKCKEDSLYPSRDNNTIRNCTIKNFYYGIYISGTINNTIANNLVEQNSDAGIFLYLASNNTLINNTANYNGYDGIWLGQSVNNNITNNVANHNGLDGIILSYSSNNNNITNNTANLNSNGIYVFGSSSYNQILNNRILNNTDNGIAVSDCTSWNLSSCSNGNFNNTIANNQISNNKIGIFSKLSGSIINNNFVWNNVLNFNSTNWLSSSGDNNTCGITIGWNDNNVVGCMYSYIGGGDQADDIFDAVEMLEYLNNGKFLTHEMDYYNLNNDNTINLFDVFALIDKIVIGKYT